MKNKYLRLILAAIMAVGIALLASGHVAWAGQKADTAALALEGQGEFSASSLRVQPGSVKPPSDKFYGCIDGTYSVGGVVVLEIKDLKPSYCVEAVLWNPRFQIHRLPDGAGNPMAHFLFLRIYYAGRLTYEIPAGDGIVTACYAVPPDKQAQFYFYNFYGVRFKKLDRPPTTWDTLDTTVDANNKTACALTQVSGVYALVGK